MNRTRRAQTARETLEILESGAYRAEDGRAVSIRQALEAACAATRLYRPGELDRLLAEVRRLPPAGQTTVAVSRRTTLAAGRALAAAYPSLACLNFASAKNPGGGFLGGAEAQEESLARASGLYAAVRARPEFYEHHRAPGTALYSDHVIFSPAVPVFRDDAGALLGEPWRAAFITAAAPNAGAVRQNEPHRVGEILPTLERRARMVLAVAAAERCEALVLGAWGCGVFRNDPAQVADVFARALGEPPFHNRFRHVEMAIYDSSPHGATFRVFEERFSADR